MKSSNKFIIFFDTPIYLNNASTLQINFGTHFNTRCLCLLENTVAKCLFSVLPNRFNTARFMNMKN